jgi:ParB-like chromosome segregation protein Spo0J
VPTESNGEQSKKKKIIIVPKKSKPEVKDAWPLAELKDHPKQHVYFEEPTPAEVAKLAANLKRNSQTEAVEITPRGVIISGHKRVLAARSLGWKTIRVLVRYDLAGDEVAIEHRLIEANEDRRHLSTFERARLQYRMSQLSPKENTRKARGEINDELAKTLDKTVRQVSRYIRLFEGPQELLDAVQDGRLLVSHAFAVLKLPQRQVEPILAVLRRGEADMTVVRAMVKQAASGHQPPGKSQPAAVLAKLLSAAEELAGHEAELKKVVTGDQLNRVVKLRKLLQDVENRGSAT